MTGGLDREQVDLRGVLAGVPMPPRSIRPEAILASGSVAARVLAHPAMLLGGPRATLLQIAHPSVAAGVSDHSRFTEQLSHRLVRTLATVGAVAFGGAAERDQALHRLFRVHSAVRGTTADGIPYSATQPELTTWVWATLVDTAIAVDRRWLGLLGARVDEFLDATAPVGTAFGVPHGALPVEQAGFAAWMEESVRGLVVGPEARAIAATVLRPRFRMPDGSALAGGVLRAAEALGWPAIGAITAELLPPPMVRAFGLASPTRTQRRAIDVLAVTMRHTASTARSAGRPPHPDRAVRIAAALSGIRPGEHRAGCHSAGVHEGPPRSRDRRRSAARRPPAR